jgi:hypothetical protein
MTWGDEGRQLPPNWHSLVRAVKHRAKATSPLGIEQCEAKLPRSGKRCPDRGIDVDHTGDKDDHSLGKLRLLCEHHHDQKTAGQGHEAWAAKKAPKQSLRRDEHPGRRLR